MHFWHIFLDLATLWDPFSINLPSFWHHFFEHCFHIGFVSILRWILVSAFIFVLIPFSVRVRKLRNLQKGLFFTMNLHVSTHQKNRHNFHDSCCYLFWHWFLITLAIDFGFALEPFLCFSAIVFVDQLRDGIFLHLTRFLPRKWMPKRLAQA